MMCNKVPDFNIATLGAGDTIDNVLSIRHLTTSPIPVPLLEATEVTTMSLVTTVGSVLLGEDLEVGDI